MFIFIVNLYKRHAGELLQRNGQRLCNGIGGAIGLAVTDQINTKDAIGELNPAISDESIPDRDQAATLLDRIGPLEVFIQDGGYGIHRSGNLARDRFLKRRNPFIDLFQVREINPDRDQGGCRRGRRRRGRGNR